LLPEIINQYSLASIQREVGSGKWRASLTDQATTAARQGQQFYQYKNHKKIILSLPSSKVYILQ
jgi:hypothetical protein